MNNLSLSFSVVFPLFCMMVLGYTLRKFQLFNDAFLKQLNHLCFHVFLPFILFSNIYKSHFGSDFPIKLILFSIICVLLCFVLLMVIVPMFEKNNKRKGVIVQGIFRSNFVIFGIPITASLYGEENTVITAILLAFIIPLFNLLSVIALEAFSDKKTEWWDACLKVFQNPLIIASILGFIFILTGIKLPIIIETTIIDISKVATPLALIVLGGQFTLNRLGKSSKPLFFSVLGKLIIVPALFIPISIFFNFRDIELVALLGMFASPTAVSSFVMAENIQADGELAGQIVVVDSILSVFSIFLWISLLKYWSFI